MNLNEYEGSFLFKSPSFPAIALYPTQQKWKCLHTRNRQYTEFQIFGVVGSFGENLDFFSPLGFDVRTNSDKKTPKNLLSQSFETLSE